MNVLDYLFDIVANKKKIAVATLSIKMKNSIGLIPIMILVFVSCQADRSGYNGKISDDLQEYIVDYPEFSGSEEDNSNLLIGEGYSYREIVAKWELVKFAYTVDGENYKDIAVISKISEPSYSINEKIITVLHGNLNFTVNELTTTTLIFTTEYYFYSISDNSIRLTDYRNPLYVNINYTDDAFDVMHALKYAQSYIIKDNELFIYFTGLKNKNLLILKKHES